MSLYSSYSYSNCLVPGTGLGAWDTLEQQNRKEKEKKILTLWSLASSGKKVRMGGWPFIFIFPVISVSFCCLIFVSLKSIYLCVTLKTTFCLGIISNLQKSYKNKNSTKNILWFFFSFYIDSPINILLHLFSCVVFLSHNIQKDASPSFYIYLMFWCFRIIGFRLYIFSWNIADHPFSFSGFHIWRHDSHLSIISTGNFGAPVQGFVQFLQYVTAFFPFATNKETF